MGPPVVWTVVVGEVPICASWPGPAGCSSDWSCGAAVAVDMVVTLVTGVRLPGIVAIGAAWWKIHSLHDRRHRRHDNLSSAENYPNQVAKLSPLT